MDQDTAYKPELENHMGADHKLCKDNVKPQEARSERVSRVKRVSSRVKIDNYDSPSNPAVHTPVCVSIFDLKSFVTVNIYLLID